MKINYDKLFNPYNVEIKEDVSDIDAIIEYEEIMYAISEYIINYRKKHNLTQKQLAEKINKKQSMISKLESGDYNPTFKEIYNLSRMLENSSDIFIDILKSIESKIRKISLCNYKVKINLEDVTNKYSNKKSSNVIEMPYKGKIGGIIDYGEYSSSISNVG